MHTGFYISKWHCFPFQKQEHLWVDKDVVYQNIAFCFFKNFIWCKFKWETKLHLNTKHNIHFQKAPIKCFDHINDIKISVKMTEINEFSGSGFPNERHFFRGTADSSMFNLCCSLLQWFA